MNREQYHKTKRGELMRKLVVLVTLLFSVALLYSVSRADDAAMTKEQLKSLLGKPDVIIIDVRTNYDYDNSKVKIPGSVHEEGMKFGAWMNKYPKDKTIVLYCA
jgi:predicted sulfurtransferase